MARRTDRATRKFTRHGIRPGAPTNGRVALKIVDSATFRRKARARAAGAHFRQISLARPRAGRSSVRDSSRRIAVRHHPSRHRPDETRRAGLGDSRRNPAADRPLRLTGAHRSLGSVACVGGDGGADLGAQAATAGGDSRGRATATRAGPEAGVGPTPPAEPSHGDRDPDPSPPVVRHHAAPDKRYVLWG
jgi:hypothetical protein